MIEIRPIREDETDAYLRVLCTVFELDLQRAKSIILSEPLFDLRRKWAVVDGTDVVSILSTVPLEFGWGRASGIASVATLAERRREGLAAQLIDQVVRQSVLDGESAVFLFARDPRLYASLGFSVLDHVVQAPIRVTGRRPSDPLDFPDVQKRYDAWAEARPNRLRRNVKRWQYWRWNIRLCYPLGSAGYGCLEGGLVREIVPGELGFSCLGGGLEWVGLQGVADGLGLDLGEPRSDLLLMGRGVPVAPEIFLTDQF